MMEIAEKYKQTEVGLIPSDWEVKNIGQEIDLLTGFPFPSSGYSESGVRLLRCSNIKRGVTDWSEGIVQYWSKITPNLKPYVLNEGDIVIAMDGSLVGKSFARLTNSDLPAILLQRVARIRSTKIEMGYLKEFVCSDYFTKYCDTVKTSSAIPHISPGDIRGFAIPIPPTKAEQTAIATALSDADALISSLEKLIAKKRMIKQGAMQQLLQPKEGWEVKKLGEIATFYKGKGLPKSDLKETGKYKCIHYGELFTKYNESINTILSYTDENDNCFYSVSNDVLMPTSDVTPNGLATASCINEDGVILGGDVLVIRILPSILEGIFLSYYVTQNREQVMKLVSGSTVYHLYGSDMKDFEIVYPNIEEQTRIATILSDMDAEITALETKLEKYRKVKLGMMQNLLTGKIRLI